MSLTIILTRSLPRSLLGWNLTPAKYVPLKSQDLKGAIVLKPSSRNRHLCEGGIHISVVGDQLMMWRQRSFYSGLLSSIRLIFQLRFHFFNRFSRKFASGMLE